jgi:hypothetical protein
MVRHTWSCGFVGLALVFGVALVLGSTSMAQAETWTFTDVTIQKPATQMFYEMTPAISTAFPKYDWSYLVTKVDAQLNWGLWLTPYTNLSDSGQATIVGPFAGFDMWNEHVNEDALKGDIRLWVNANGNPHLDMSNLVYGSMYGADVTGLRASGTITVTGVPEPTGVLMLASGAIAVGLILVRRRGR